MCVSAVAESSNPPVVDSEPGPTNFFLLKPSTEGVPDVHISVPLRATPFDQEPSLSEHATVYRGVLPVGPDDEDKMAFLCALHEGAMYFDLNRNGDLTDDPPQIVGEFPEDGSSFGYPLSLPLARASASISYELSFIPSQSTVEFWVKSGWAGTALLGDAEYHIAVTDDLDGVFENRDRLLLVPAGTSPEPTKRQAAASEMPLPANLFVAGRLYALACRFSDDGVTVDFTEMPCETGSLLLGSDTIDQLTLFYAASPEADVCIPALLHHPPQLVSVPEGHYRCVDVDLYAGSEAAVFGAFGPVDLVVDPRGEPAELPMGPPLCNRLTARRFGNRLYTRLVLTDAADFYYSHYCESPREAITYTITHAGRILHSGSPDPLFVPLPGDCAQWHIPLLTLGPVEVAASRDLGSLGLADAEPVTFYWSPVPFILRVLLLLLPAVVLLALAARRGRAHWHYLLVLYPPVLVCLSVALVALFLLWLSSLSSLYGRGYCATQLILHAYGLTASIGVFLLAAPWLTRRRPFARIAASVAVPLGVGLPLHILPATRFPWLSAGAYEHGLFMVAIVGAALLIRTLYRESFVTHRFAVALGMAVFPLAAVLWFGYVLLSLSRDVGIRPFEYSLRALTWHWQLTGHPLGPTNPYPFAVCAAFGAAVATCLVLGLFAFVVHASPVLQRDVAGVLGMKMANEDLDT